jgi:hypothetical protein
MLATGGGKRKAGLYRRTVVYSALKQWNANSDTLVDKRTYSTLSWTLTHLMPNTLYI